MGYRFSAVGIYFYGAAMAGFGVIHWAVWNVIYLFAALAIFLRFQRRRLALLLVAGMYLVMLLGVHLPALVTHIYDGNNWAVLFEGLMIGSGALIIADQLPNDPGMGPRWGRVIQTGAVVGHYLFTSALFLFAIQHIIYFDFIVTLIPAWMPMKVGLAYLVIAAYILSGISFVIGRGVGLAAFFLGIMFGLWVILLHAPRAIGKWNVETEWASLCVALAVCGVSLSISRRETVSRPEGLIVLPHV